MVELVTKLQRLLFWIHDSLGWHHFKLIPVELQKPSNRYGFKARCSCGVFLGKAK